MGITINQIQERVRATGSHWFDPVTMRCFGTRIAGDVYDGPGGIYFVTSDKQFDGSRAFTVRQFDPASNQISTVGDVGRFSGKVAAKKDARKLAGENAQATDERLRAITDAEQFLHDLQSHGYPDATSTIVRSLMTNARWHHRGSEYQCNGDPRGDRMVRQAEKNIEAACKAIGCKPLFSGDPRGCTAKLIMPDGFTDDFGKEGLCIPLAGRSE